VFSGTVRSSFPVWLGSRGRADVRRGAQEVRGLVSVARARPPGAGAVPRGLLAPGARGSGPLAPPTHPAPPAIAQRRLPGTGMSLECRASPRPRSADRGATVAAAARASDRGVGAVSAHAGTAAARTGAAGGAGVGGRADAGAARAQGRGGVLAPRGLRGMRASGRGRVRPPALFARCSPSLPQWSCGFWLRSGPSSSTGRGHRDPRGGPMCRQRDPHQGPRAVAGAAATGSSGWAQGGS